MQHEEDFELPHEPELEQEEYRFQLLEPNRLVGPVIGIAIVKSQCYNISIALEKAQKEYPNGDLYLLSYSEREGETSLSKTYEFVFIVLSK